MRNARKRYNEKTLSFTRWHGEIGDTMAEESTFDQLQGGIPLSDDALADVDGGHASAAPPPNWELVDSGRIRWWCGVCDSYASPYGVKERPKKCPNCGADMSHISPSADNNISTKYF